MNWREYKTFIVVVIGALVMLVAQLWGHQIHDAVATWIEEDERAAELNRKAIEERNTHTYRVTLIPQLSDAAPVTIIVGGTDVYRDGQCVTIRWGFETKSVTCGNVMVEQIK